MLTKNQLHFYRNAAIIIIYVCKRKMKMKDFEKALYFVKLEASYDQLVLISHAMKARREEIARTVKRTFKEGQSVTFHHRGKDYAGIIKAIKTKKATVECKSTEGWQPGSIFWNHSYVVPLTMLKAA